ncbi:MAG TPA: FixH family protein, partial [Polyangiaceae bacterium]|nr:FixH family protein [Polyangiaceae bacterium]
RSGRTDVLTRPSALVVRAALVVGFVTMSCGCSGGDPIGKESSGTTPLPPGCEGRGEAMVRGMVETSEDGLLAVTLADATPLPPVQGENTWTVDVSEADAPVLDEGDADAQVIANIYMAEHDHNIRKRGTMTAPGVFEFAQFPITMNGYWEITIQVQSDADVNEREDAVFGFCVRN